MMLGEEVSERIVMASKEQDIWKAYGRDTPMFSWKGKSVKARIVDVHDSDTCRVVFQSSPGVYSQFIIRLDGIDGPELNSHDPQEVQAALRARNRLLSLLAPGVFDQYKDYSKKEVLALLAENTTMAVLSLSKSDKYGRTLAQVFPDNNTLKNNKSVNQILIDEGVVHAYAGKTKQPWTWSLV